VTRLAGCYGDLVVEERGGGGGGGIEATTWWMRLSSVGVRILRGRNVAGAEG
jgi:hypothetical protein